LVEHTGQTALQDDDEISLVDIIRFFRHNGKFLALTTLGLSAIAITLSLLQPKQYQKQLTLSVKSGSLTLSSPSLGNPRQLVDLDINQLSNLAVTLLQNQPPEQTNSTAKYTVLTQQIDLTLQSANPNALTAADSKVLSRLAAGFQRTLDKIVATNLNRIELDLQRSRRLLKEMETQIAQTPKTPTTTAPNPRLLALEEQRSRYVDSITSLQFDKQYLAKAQKNPAQFVSQAILVQILSQSQVRSARSPLKVAVLAVIAGFMVATLAAIIRDQVVRSQDKMSKQKIE
jgi:hypothetical protein